tara:strand:+ start:473 stop:661 length:189 start_codon:yes stop_codon:yes gene_type:complete
MFQYLNKILKKKTKLEKLQKKHSVLLKKSYQAAKTNRKESDKYIYEANEISKEIDKIINEQS